jgi:hypothetical protein
MVSFVDGPLADTTLMLRRAPLFLRAVTDAAGKADALDQVDDVPAGDELVHVYRRRGDASVVCIRPGGCYAMASYVYVPDAFGDELYDTDGWRRWVDGRAREEGLIA